MNIIIIGCGQVGTTLAGQLSGEEHDITVIDKDENKIATLIERFDIMGVCGNGVSITVLEEAGIENADILIAVTESDEINLLCCVMAKKATKCHTIARVRSPIYSGETDFIKKSLGITRTINPELETASEIAHILKYPSAENIDSFAKGKVKLVKIKITESSPLANAEIREIYSKTGVEMLVCAIERGTQVIIPFGSTLIKAGDTVSFVAEGGKVRNILSKLSLRHKPVKSAMIVGGDTIAYYLSKKLIKSGVDVKIIDSNIERCERLHELLPEVTVIHGDDTDKKLLLDEGLESAGAFVANTHIDEENIFLSMFTKDISKAKIVSKVNRLDFDNLIKGLDIGTVIYPKYLTADYIMQYVRALKNSAGNNVSTLYRLLDNTVEAIEFAVNDDSPVTSKPIMNLNLKQNLLICCICRDDKVIIPGGNDSIEKGDSVIVVTLEKGLDDISDIIDDRG